jgi:hypothetical protein
VDERSSSPTLGEVAESWQAARVDVAAGTAQTYRVALGRVLPRLGGRGDRRHRRPARGGRLVGDLHKLGLKKQTIRKTVSVLAMVLDHARVPRRYRLPTLLLDARGAHPRP